MIGWWLAAMAEAAAPCGTADDLRTALQAAGPALSGCYEDPTPLPLAGDIDKTAQGDVRIAVPLQIGAGVVRLAGIRFEGNGSPGILVAGPASVTIVGGSLSGMDQGAIVVLAGDLTVGGAGADTTVFSGNTGFYGGDIGFTGAGRLDVRGIVSSDAAGVLGGAIAVVKATGTVQIADSAFERPHASAGGVLYVAVSDVAFDRNTVTDASAGVGGVATLRKGSLAAAGGTWTGVSADVAGGAIAAVGADITLSGTAIEGCSAGGQGGALWLGASTTVLSGATISGCSASEAGIGWVEGGALTVTGARFAGASAAGGPAGWHLAGVEPAVIRVTRFCEIAGTALEAVDAPVDVWNDLWVDVTGAPAVSISEGTFAQNTRVGMLGSLSVPEGAAWNNLEAPDVDAWAPASDAGCDAPWAASVTSDTRYAGEVPTTGWTNRDGSRPHLGWYGGPLALDGDADGWEDPVDCGPADPAVHPFAEVGGVTLDGDCVAPGDPGDPDDPGDTLPIWWSGGGGCVSAPGSGGWGALAGLLALRRRRASR